VQKLTEDQHRFVEDLGHQMVGWGLPRNTGRIWAYLLLCGAATGLDDISAGIGVGKSSVSVGTRQLVQFGLARPIGERGSRRLLYEALYSLDTIFAARQAELVNFLAKLRRGAASLPPGTGRERMEEMAATVQGFVDEAPAILQQLRDRRPR
jgi:DNA-binding transcriptional regulator GbsR (MarR family)